MSNYLLIDSNEELAEKLHQVLSNDALVKYGQSEDVENLNYWNCSNFSDLGELSDKVQAIAKTDDEKIILINAEAKLKGGFIQDQELVELAFWLRCKHKLENAIVFYSLQSANHLLKTKPENFILVSPGCYHLRLPVSKDKILKIAEYKPLKNLNSIKPFLKPKINLEQTRHRFANYAGMALMLLTAKEIYSYNHINQILGKESRKNQEFKDFYSFWDSLDYSLLSIYYNLETSFKISIGEKKRLERKNDKNILLIDDLAKEGWSTIISQMIYGNNADPSLECLQIQYKEVNEKKQFDVNVTKSELEKHIDEHKPHLILLDLRLNDEEGKKDIKQFGGFKLLKSLKKSPFYKGLPVIMFTASSNAETTKKLIEAGAEAVWTKPGLDESLSTKQIVERYDLLTRYVENEFFKFDERIKVESREDIEETRLRVLQKVEFIKYRTKLINLKNSDHFFNQFTDIVVDTNIVMEDENTICSVFKLARICGKTKHKIKVQGEEFNVAVPKVVLHNFVIDEIIHFSKAKDPYKPVFWKVGLLAYDVIRGLFQDDLVRTEINSFPENSNRPLYLLEKTEYYPYADPELIKYIVRIVSGRQFEIKRWFKEGREEKSESKNVNYLTPNSKVLLITNENPIDEKKIPRLLETKYSKLVNPQGTIEIINTKAFVERIEEISL